MPFLSFVLSVSLLAKIPAIIDAGHGGTQLGAVGICGIVEKDITLNISKKIALLLNQTPFMDAILARTQDHDLSLNERVFFANQKHAELFVSIHANWSNIPSIQGFEVYTSTPKHFQHHQSQLFATIMQQSFTYALKQENRNIHDAPFQVLQTATMPAILVEVGFLSNTEECERLSSTSYQQHIAQSIARGILAYLSATHQTHLASINE